MPIFRSPLSPIKTILQMILLGIGVIHVLSIPDDITITVPAKAILGAFYLTLAAFIFRS